jgi:hypothetical protein
MAIRNYPSLSCPRTPGWCRNSPFWGKNTPSLPGKWRKNHHLWGISPSETLLGMSDPLQVVCSNVTLGH